MKISNIRFRACLILYGADFAASVMLDDLLEYIKEQQCYTCPEKDRKGSEQVIRELGFLVALGYISEADKGICKITQQGEQFVASGGFSGKIIKSRNDLLVLPVAIATLLIAAVTLVVALFK